MRVVLSVGEIQLGKNLLRLDWENAIYWPLFMLANTLLTAKPFFKIILYLNFN